MNYNLTVDNLNEFFGVFLKSLIFWSILCQLFSEIFWEVFFLKAADKKIFLGVSADRFCMCMFPGASDIIFQ